MSITDDTVILPSTPSGRPFEVILANSPGASTVRISGTLDMGSSLLLEEILTWLCRDGHRVITVDANDLRTLHSAALAALYRAHHVVRTSGGALSLTGSSPLARRLAALATPEAS